MSASTNVTPTAEELAAIPPAPEPYIPSPEAIAAGTNAGAVYPTGPMPAQTLPEAAA